MGSDVRIAPRARGGATEPVAVQRVLILLDPRGEPPGLEAALQRHVDAAAARFHVVVPATPPDDQLVGWVFSEHLDPRGREAVGFRLARLRLERAVRRLREAGLEVDGEVGDPDPLRAVVQTLRRSPAQEVVVPLPRTRGLEARARARMVRRLRARVEVPITAFERQPTG